MALKNQHCTPVKGTPPLSAVEVHELLAQVPGWQAAEDCRSLDRQFGFKDFHDTMAFVNALAFVAHREDHHPDLEVGYNRCTVHYSTHAVGGLSRNDFICAARVNALLE
jgi:4a-hydroxytetrahydrobiopterin dehydratase